MTNEIIVDSSVLIEFIKGNKTILYKKIITELDNESFINETIVSEFLFYFLAINSNKSPRSLQSSNEINKVFSHSFEYMLLENFSYLSNDTRLYALIPELMKKYNLLPNDAIILATCKLHGITRLASHDTDFIIPCAIEGILLLTENN